MNNQKLQVLALIIALLGIFILLILLIFQPPKQINQNSDISKLEINTKVQISGKVISEYQYPTTKLLKLDNSLEIDCSSCPKNQTFLNQTISVLGTIQRYQNKTQIQALRIIQEQ